MLPRSFDGVIKVETERTRQAGKILVLVKMKVISLHASLWPLAHEVFKDYVYYKQMSLTGNIVMVLRVVFFVDTVMLIWKYHRSGIFIFSANCPRVKFSQKHDTLSNTMVFSRVFKPPKWYWEWYIPPVTA